MWKTRTLVGIAVASLALMPTSAAFAGRSGGHGGGHGGEHGGGHGGGHNRGHSGGHRGGSHFSFSYGNHGGYGHSSYNYGYGRPYYRSHSYRSRRHYRSHSYNYRPYRYRSHRYQRGYGYYNYSPISYGSYGGSSYGYDSCPTYGSYGGSYRSYSPYSSYRRVGSYSGYGGAYPAPVVVNPLTPDRSPTYQQAKPSIEAYRQWQQDGQQAASAPEPAPKVSDPGPDAHADLHTAWGSIAKGESRKALGEFASVCEANPTFAPAKAGYAVAAALAGDERLAVWAMRRAFEAGADKVGYLPTDEGIAPILDGLVQAIRSDLAQEGDSADRLFLLAGIEVLRHDDDAARAAAERAQELGDTHRGLKKMVEYLKP